MNTAVLNRLENNDDKQVLIRRCDEAELDEIWSYVGNKSTQRWLWHAIDHHTGEILAYFQGRRKDHVFKQLKSLLEPFGIKRFYTDDWGAYERILDKESHHIGKKTLRKLSVSI